MRDDEWEISNPGAEVRGFRLLILYSSLIARRCALIAPPPAYSFIVIELIDPDCQFDCRLYPRSGASPILRL